MNPRFEVDRHARESVTGQIGQALRVAIAAGQLAPGARLPSWRDLASQLGVARGTVQAAYETLVDAGLVVTSGAAGTHVARQIPPMLADDALPVAGLRDPIADYPRAPGVFQMGVPAQDGFPAKVWSRICMRATRESADAGVQYPDPRGEPALRSAIAAYVAVARGIACSPAQVFVTSGHSAGVSMAVLALALKGQAWLEDPGYPPARQLLSALGMQCVPVPVDAEGLDVAAGRRLAPDAALAVVTPGAQAPLGVLLSADRRRALADWAAAADAWLLEDDYLGELQLQGRAVPSLAATDGGRRVLHIGTFSKTISPTLRLGFVVVPAAQVARFDEAAVLAGTAPTPSVQWAVAGFIRDGHLLRHLRRMKRLYLQRREGLVACLQAAGITHRPTALAVLMRLPPGVSDVDLTRDARRHGLAPVPLSPWYAAPAAGRQGLLLGVTNLRPGEAAQHWAALKSLIDQASA